MLQVIDNDMHFTIDPESHLINTASDSEVTIAQRDHNSERITFQIPKTIEGFDLLQCNKVEIHFSNISKDKTQQNDDIYPVKDLREFDKDTLIFSWLISIKATQLIGSLTCSVRFTLEENTEIKYSWGTEDAVIARIVKSKNNTSTMLTTYSDLLEAWRQDILRMIVPAIRSVDSLPENDIDDTTFYKVEDKLYAHVNNVWEEVSWVQKKESLVQIIGDVMYVKNAEILDELLIFIAANETLIF